MNKEIIDKARECIHDINNQLTVIKGKGEKLLAKENLQDNPDLIKIVDKADKTAEIVRELRELIHKIDL